MLHLAWHFRRADVDAFLDELTQEQLNEWRAYRDYIGTDDWRQAGKITQAIYGVGAGFAGEKTPGLENFTDTLSEPTETADPIANLKQTAKALSNGNTRKPGG